MIPVIIPVKSKKHLPLKNLLHFDLSVFLKIIVLKEETGVKLGKYTVIEIILANINKFKVSIHIFSHCPLRLLPLVLIFFRRF